MVLAPICHLDAVTRRFIQQTRTALLQTGDMQEKDVDNVDLGHKLQLDLYS